MKITITTTEIEATAQDLRESNTLAGSFSNFIRRIFQTTEPYDEECEEERDEDEQHTN